MPSTLRTELDRLDFNWERGGMMVQEGNYRVAKSLRIIEEDDPLLDERWSNGPGYLDVPRFIAADDDAVYVVQRDGRGCGLKRIYKEPARYMDLHEDIPYPDQ